MVVRRWGAVAALLLALCACSGDGDATGESPPGSVIASPAIPSPAPTSPSSASSPRFPPAPNVGTPSTREAEVRTAVDLLVEEMGYPAGEVRVVRVEDVVWPSGALGCPAWADGQTVGVVPGYRIILGHREVELHYHGADGEDPRRCDFLDF
ncbi:MAG: hypothetical protein WCA30_08750 [Dermatophilaceae bacterium]